MNAMLKIGALLGLSGYQMEQFMLNEMHDSIDSHLFRQKFVAIHLIQTYYETVGTRSIPRPTPYSDPRAKIRIFMSDQAAADLMIRENVVPSITLGRGEHKMRVEMPMQLLVPITELESLRMTATERKEAEVLAQAAQYDPARDVHRLEVHLKILIAPDKMSAFQRMQIPDIAEALIEACGGAGRGLAGCIFSHDDKNRPDLNGRQPTIFLFMNKSRADSSTDTHLKFKDRLLQGNTLCSHALFTDIPLKGDINIKKVNRAAQQAADTVHPIGQERVKQRLEAHHWNIGGTYFPATTTSGDAVVWPGKKGYKVIEMHELGVPGQPWTDDGVVLLSLLSLFREGETTPEQLMVSVRQLVNEGVLIAYDPDDRVSPDGREAVTIYSVFKDVYTADEPERADDDMEEDDKKGDPADQEKDKKQGDEASSGAREKGSDNTGGSGGGPGGVPQGDPGGDSHTNGAAGGSGGLSSAAIGISQTKCGPSASEMEVENPAPSDPATA
jgi:hypothetical protein